MKNLKAHELITWFNDLSAKECGALQGAFLKKFLFWNLFINSHISNQSRGTCTLYAIRAYSGVSDGDLGLLDNDQMEMIRFIEGFVAGLRSIRKKKPSWGG